MKKEFSKNKNVKSFISLIEKGLKQKKGKLLLIPSGKTKSFEDGQFSEADMEIKCTVDLSSNYWVGVLAHEYSHFIQCSENLDIWNNFQEKMTWIKNDDDIFTGKSKIRKAKRKIIIASIIKLELDCDKKAVGIIKKYNLPVDLKEYVSKANIVLYKYVFWGEYGHWPSITCKKTNKRTYWEDFKISKLLGEEKYINVDQIPRKLFYTFQEN